MTLIYCVHGSEWFVVQSGGYIHLTRVTGCKCGEPGSKTFKPATETSPKAHWHGTFETKGGTPR